MSRLMRSVAAVVVVLLCLLVIPGAYTAAEKAESKAEGSEQEAATPTPTPEEATPSPDPEPTQPEEQPTESPEPEPTESAEPVDPTPTPSAPEAGRRTRSARALAPSLAATVTVSPDEIAVGETATISTEVANEGDDTAGDAHVDVFVPIELDVVSTTPPADSQATNPDVTTLGFELGDLEPDDSETVTVVVEASEEAEGQLSIAADATAAGDLFASDSAPLTIAPTTGTLAVSTSSAGLLTQVGSTASFDVTVSNTGAVALENVAVIDIAPREIDVLPPTKLPKGVDAVQVGTSGQLQDIVWIIDKLPSGKTLDLSWRGVVDSAGDLAAVNRVTATADNADSAKAQSMAYLVQPGGSSTSNPPVEPRTRRVVTRRQVVVQPPILTRPATETSVSESTGEALPFTGIDPGAIALIAVGLVGMGIGLLFLARRGAEARRLTSVALLALLLGTACVTNDGDPSATPEISPRVKGTQIERGDDNDPDAEQDRQNEDPNGDDNTDADPDTSGDENDGDTSPESDDNDPSDDDSGDDADLPDDLDEDLAGPVAPAEPEVRTVRTVRTVTIDETDLAVVNLATFSGTDALSFGWNDPSTSITHATSATSAAPGDAARLETSISPSGTGMRVTVTLINPSSTRRLAVDGHVSLQLGGELLRGPGTNVVLNPDGEISQSFSFRLPSGNYTARPTFSAS